MQVRTSRLQARSVQVTKKIGQYWVFDGAPPQLGVYQRLRVGERTVRNSELLLGKFEIPGKTTRTNEASYFETISIEDLPTTFRDALIISRSLNIPYLWVDALCIVQDDIDDWRAEVTNMSDIYFGSALTIAASDAKDSTGGFFARPSATNSEETIAQSRALFIVEGSDCGSDLLVHVESRGSAPDGMSSILHTRGWTLQELALSHRTVQFTHSELHWRCRSAYWTESGMTYDASSTVYGNIPVLGQDHLRNPVLTWWKWIESYSARKLTVSSDRIPAICGLIKYHQSVTGDSSAMGLWKSSLHQDILWMRTTGLTEKDLASPNSGIVPSWSWLSCPVGVSFDFFGRHLKNTEIYNHITIHNYELSWTGEPFISDIKSSRLTISGPARETFLEVAPEGSQCRPPYFLVDGEIPDFTEHALPWSCAAQFDREQERSPDKFLCILVRRRVDMITGYRTETFLILEPVNLIIENQMFRRIGLGMFRGYSDRFSMNIRKTVSLV
jgi:hypothetical protein